MKCKTIPGITLALVLGILTCACGQTKQPAQPALEKFNGGFFTIDKPAGWQLVTAGQCTNFAFMANDPSAPLRRLFFFGQVGPVYLSQQQKQIDYQYMNMGGYPVAWIEMPVISPFTPSNFLSQFYQIANTRVARQFMPQCPALENLQIISAQQQQCPIAGGFTELVRALFTEQGQIGEGLFMVTVAPFMAFTGGPGGGNGYGLMFTGITAPKSEFAALQDVMARSLESFNLSQAYAENCMRQQADTYAGILSAGKTLSEASDKIMEGWQNRNRSEDIMAEKRSDAILGKERLYNPETGDVYEFDNGFYDNYNLHRNQYEMNGLQQLPADNYNLWTKVPLNGANNLR